MAVLSNFGMVNNALGFKWSKRGLCLALFLSIESKTKFDIPIRSAALEKRNAKLKGVMTEMHAKQVRFPLFVCSTA